MLNELLYSVIYILWQTLVGANCIYCVDIPGTGFDVLWIIFIPGHNLWTYQRLDLLSIGCSLHPEVDSVFVQTL